MKKMVSVIMAAYNAEKFIEESIKSIQNQTYSEIEILICDDCSDDNTVQIVQKIAQQDSRIVLLQNTSKLFASGSRNQCLKAARGEYIAIQDADDISAPDRLEKLVDAIETYGEYDFVSSAEALFNADIQKPFRVVDHKRFPKKTNFLRGMCFCHAGTLFRKQCFETPKGGYPESKKNRRHEDYLLFMRLYAQGFRGFNVDDCLYFYRVDKATLSRRTFRSALQECGIRVRGFWEMHIFLIGIPFIFVPIIAYFKNLLFRKREI